MKIKGVKGANDILPDQVGEWQFIENQARKLFELYGFQEIRLPIFEHTELFVRSVGEATDIVTKEMYTFEDKGEKSLTLRPEATASVVRAYLEHHFSVKEPFQKFYYLGPMFRRERPQAGRSRQFHQLGVEVLGNSEPSVDAEVITLLFRFFEQIGLPDVQILLNSVGCHDCRKNYIGKLKEYLQPQQSHLCLDCQTRVQKNILRVLDCKTEGCQPIIKDVPQVLNCICEACQEHFKKVTGYLDAVYVKYQVQPRLVRGLDYYTRTVFEITHHALGAQNAVGAGGRYDNLIGDFGGPKELGATGFALGIERILLALKNSNKTQTLSNIPLVCLISLGDEAFDLNFKLLNELRSCGVRAEMVMQQKSLKAQMRQADRSQAVFSLLRGENEIQQSCVIVKNMAQGVEEKVDEKRLLDFFKEKQKG